MKCFGLTGGIASGKSSIANLLSKAGIPVINADVLARIVVEPGSSGHQQIVARFGNDYLAADGTIDRKKLAALVFNEAAARKDLETIVHPLVAMQFKQQLDRLEQDGHKYAVYEAPLIFETGIQNRFNATILVVSNSKNQIDRLAKRDKMSEEDAWARLNAQMVEAKKIELADAVIDNNGSMARTQQQLVEVWQELTGERLSI